MSFTDELGPSSFCRKMEKARPMREEMFGKVVCLPPDLTFSTLMLYLKSTFPYLYLDLACKQLYFPPGNGINRRNGITSSDFFGALKPQQALCCNDDIEQFSSIILFPLLKTVNNNLIFPFRKDNQKLMTENTNPVVMVIRNKKSWQH